MIVFQDDEEGGEAFDMMNREVEEDDNVKVHEIKFDEYGIMDDGLDDSTEKQLEAHKKATQGKSSENSLLPSRVIIYSSVAQDKFLSMPVIIYTFVFVSFRVVIKIVYTSTRS
jgi:hypothetical protein